MNDIDDDTPLEARSIDEERLRWALRDLRRDTLPQHDLWPHIAARIAAGPAVQRPAHRRVDTRVVGWAMAASVLLAVALVWQLRPASQAPGGETLIAREARAMTSEYSGALQELSAQAPVAASADPALAELDRSAAQIRSALARDPDARFLLERLRHTYALRLALTQRAVLS
jgi:hypothetical protein